MINKINEGKYCPIFPMSSDPKAYWAEARSLKEQFKNELLSELKINNAKGRKLFDILDKSATTPYTKAYYIGMHDMIKELSILIK